MKTKFKFDVLTLIMGLLALVFFTICTSNVMAVPVAAVAIPVAGLFFIDLYISPTQNSALRFALFGFTKVCTDRSGGVSSLYLAKVTDVDEFTLGTLLDAKKFTAVTMLGDAVFAKYEFYKDTVEFKESTSRENGSTKVTKSLEFMLPKMSQETRDVVEEIAAASNCGLIAIVVDNNGAKWVVGYTVKHGKDKPLELATAEGTTGKALSDANGETIILTVDDTEKSRTFTGTVPVEE